MPRLNLDPLVPVVVLTPAAILAPDEFLRAIFVSGAVLASWVIGFYEGRADHAREVLRELRRNEPGA
jgi:hypothetical protein